MSTNIGTLINATIRPSDTLDRISTAWDNEIRGGHHSYPTLNQRNNIIIQRRSWGMTCTVYNDDVDNNGTYQLVYNRVDNDINNNSNWSKLHLDDGDGYWINIVKSVIIVEPTSPTDGDRYITGLNDDYILSGVNWIDPEYRGGSIVTWSSEFSNWIVEGPKNGWSVRVESESNQLYTYSGIYPNGSWVKENDKIISLTASSTNGVTYDSTLPGVFSYNSEQLYLVNFSATNSTTTATLNINGIGAKSIKKQTSNGLSDLLYGDLSPSLTYTLHYKNNNFIFSKPYNMAPFDIKWRIRSNESIQVPDYNEYIVYGDLTVEGRLDIDTHGRVIILNGGLDIKGGTVSNYGNVQMVNFNGPNSNYNNDITKFSTTISMTSDVTYTIIHGLNTHDIVVNTWDEITGENIFVNVIKTSSNQIELLAENNIPSVRVVIIG